MELSLLVWVGILFAAAALVGFTGRMASERGRSRAGWMVLSGAAGLAGFVAGVMLFGSALSGDATDLSLARVGFGVVTSFVGPLAAMALVVALVWKLPERVPTASGTRWRMDRLASREAPGGPCELAFDGANLHVGEVTLAPAAITELVADGECLRIAWADGTATLRPGGGDETPREKAKRSQAIAKRLHELLGAPRARPDARAASPYR